MLITRRMLELQTARRMAKMKKESLIEPVEYGAYELIYQPRGDVSVPSCVHVGKGSLLSIYEAVELDTPYCPSLRFGERCVVEVPKHICGATVVSMSDCCAFELKDDTITRYVQAVSGAYEAHYISSLASLFVLAGAGSKVDLYLSAYPSNLSISIKGGCFGLRIRNNYASCRVYSGDLQVIYNGKEQVFPEHYAGTFDLSRLGSEDFQKSTRTRFR